MIHSQRIRNFTPSTENSGNVLYWMSREQRVEDNPALHLSRELAYKADSALLVAFALTDNFLGATLRQYDFMLRGLEQVAGKLKKLNIPFILLRGEPVTQLEAFVRENKIRTLVTDFDPLRIKQQWQKELRSRLEISFLEVDGHNIVPARYVSDKVEFGAYTLRPKIHRNLDEFLEVYDPLEPFTVKNSDFPVFSAEEVLESLQLDRSVAPVDWIEPGEEAALKLLDKFIDEKLASYAALRNDPNNLATSDLSPYLHFGQISSLRIAREIIRRAPSDENSKAFLEELIVRKELADNYCLYHPDYDNPNGFHSWAKKTHEEHKDDEREYIYSVEELERAETHDPLWNASQMEMVKKGKMHGYMRMYWAKKILEWTRDIAEAMSVAIYLNDKYELDGRDPNGYTGIAWSIGGVHDRAWTERPVFGKIRYMNYNGAKRKFNIEKYIQYVRNL